MEFSKYKFYNKLLGGITLLRATSSVTWTQPYIYIYMALSYHSQIEISTNINI